MAQKALAQDIRNSYFFVDSRRLVVDDNFIEREDYGDIEAIANWILANGVQNLNPLRCYKRGEQYVIIRGHRRKKALTILEQRERQVLMVPVIVDRKGANLEQRYFEQATENDSKQYTPWEKAKVLKKARNFGWSVEKMAQESGWSAVYVRRLLMLADAPQKLIDLVRSGRVAATLAMDELAEGKAEEIIAKAENPDPAKAAPAQDLFNLPSPERVEKAERITKADIRPNSWKTFKKWAPSVEEEKLPAAKVDAWKLMKKMLSGEATEEDFEDFFK